MTAASTPAISIAIPLISNNQLRTSTIRVDGIVEGGTNAGILLEQEPMGATSDTVIGITIGVSGVVEGSVGISTAPRTINGYGTSYLTLDNAGSIRGNAGQALTTQDVYSTFSSILNREGAVINGIDAAFTRIDNQGLIDGEAGSAVSSSPNYGYNPRTILNSGTITSASAATTLTGSGNLTNSGVISNTGGGSTIGTIIYSGIIENLTGGSITSAQAATISADYLIYLTNAGAIASLGGAPVLMAPSISVTNSAGGTIAANGTVIEAQSLQLTNTGRITGNVLAGSASAQFGQTSVDTSGGVLDGNLLFGGNNDILYARYDNGALQTGVTGTIDGGAGFDTLTLRFLADGTIATPVPTLTNFEAVGIEAASGTRVVLASGFTTPVTLAVSGSGTIENQANLSLAGPVITSPQFQSTVNFINTGTITNTSTSTDFSNGAITGSFYSLTNGGIILSSGYGVNASAYSFANSGEIIATGTAVYSSQTGLPFTNAGLIQSTAGIGLEASSSTYNVGFGVQNSGTIQGATYGADLSTNLINTGIIRSPGTAITMRDSTLENRAGGLIEGGQQAITVRYAGTVANGGTITGNVTLADGLGYANPNFFALEGGVLNGNLALGRYATLVAELTGEGTSGFAGINGTVTANGASVRYRVRDDAAVALGGLPGFRTVGYDLYDGAALTLTAGADVSNQLVLAGTGSVDLAANFVTSTQPAIITGSTLDYRNYNNTPSNLTIVSHGSITLTRIDPNVYATAVVLGENDVFTNAGTIAVRDLSGASFSSLAAIVGGNVINTGTITLENAVAFSATRSIVNSGTVTGSGTLATYLGGSLTNNGMLASTNGPALSLTSNALIDNKAGGTITGTGGIAIQSIGGTIRNAGTINGSVDLGFRSDPYYYYYFGSRYVADGGTLNGDLHFSNHADVLVETGSGFGVTGTIDGGDGEDSVLHVRSATSDVTLLDTLPTNFEREGLVATGSGTIVTISGRPHRTSDIRVGGEGAIVNLASTSGSVSMEDYQGEASGDGYTYLASFENRATIGGGISVRANSLTNSGTVGASTVPTDAPDADEMGVSQYAYGTLSFSNSGSVISAFDGEAAYLVGSAISQAKIANTGTLTGGLGAYLQFSEAAQSPTASLINSGAITSAEGGTAVNLSESYYYYPPYNDFRLQPLTIEISNSGLIEQSSVGGSALDLAFQTPGAATILNSGTIKANAGGSSGIFTDPVYQYYSYVRTNPAMAINVNSYGSPLDTSITNTATGSIEATGPLSMALLIRGKLVLANAGVISGGNDIITTDPDDLLAVAFNTDRFAGAVQTIGAFDDRIDNSGTITGSVDLGGGNDTIVNTGTMTGDIRLGGGDDSFVHLISGTLAGTVSGGEGFDTFRIDASGTGAIAAAQLNEFERLVQSGSGSAAWSGNFEAPTVELDGSTLLVAAGTTLQTATEIAVTGGAGAETVVNAGTIAGSVVLGAGDDTFREIAGSTVSGRVDGGAGQDTYGFVLAGNRMVRQAGANFENLAVSGTGTLSYALDQSFAQARLDGTSLALTLNGHAIGEIVGSEGAESVSVDGDLARVALGGGGDVLAIGGASPAGSYDGGAGNDTLTFASAAPATLSGVATGFETLTLATNALTVTGTLGKVGDDMVLTGAGQELILAGGGTITGSLDLGLNNDRFRLLQGANLAGTVRGGAGEDTFSIETGTPYTLTDAVSGFERFDLGGSALTIASKLDVAGETLTFDDGDDVITIAPGGLLGGNVNLGGGNDRLTIAGAFAGSVDGGSGKDALSVSGGGSQAAPVAFGSVAGIESYSQSGGFATISGTAALSVANLSGGRLVGLAGSTIGASTITVQQGATFGSAGTVNANLAVAGTLSPGASLGTMTVNGNVSLGATSVSLLEITPSVADTLVISGTLSIAQGATLQLEPTGTIQAGRTLDLIVTGGTISGSFTNVVKPTSMFGVIVQSANRIQLLGQFLSDPSFDPQVQASIAYTNATLLNLPATSLLLAVLPGLAPGGVSDAAAFARLTPEPYASAVQASVERGLAVTQAVRALNFAPAGDAPHAFTFAQALGDWSRIGANGARGTSRARSNGYGFLGGIGFTASEWAIGGFVGYLKEDQTISALAAKTKTDGVIAGVHVRYESGAYAASASAFYDGADADTRRALPASGSANSGYKLRGLGFDAKLAARLNVGTGLAITPQLGTTWLRTRRSGTVEGGGSPFALTVSGYRQWAGFVDGSLKIEGARTVEQTIRPWASLGARYQLQGRTPVAVGGFAGGTTALFAYGASRARMTGTIEAGVDAQVSPGVDLFVSGIGDFASGTKRAGVNGGIKVSF